MLKQLITSAVLALAALSSAHAKLPAELQAIVIEPPFSFNERVFDLTAALEQAKAQNKPLFIYLGATDCPPCRIYGQFLSDHLGELKPHFDKLVVVDIRTWLKGPRIIFKIHDKRYSMSELKALLGDTNPDNYFPYRWLLQPAGTVAKQLPRGAADYLDVNKHIELLRV